ncbi:uncharacterized protein [Rutidosis leptorrhynchoides]|uniref:uncharacterized protein n=1 Tax=Rutidosis leptorrhynchoides TaxID=125765 RepID=UPI003A994F06
MGRGLGGLESLLLMIANVQLGEEKDTWEWALDGEKPFTVKKLSGLCDDLILASGNNPISTLRNNLVPKKIEIFVWRLMKKRLQMRIELVKRGIDLHCVFQWWGLGAFSNLSFNEILRGNSGVSMSTFGKKIWHAIEWISAYYIWKNRNNKNFRGTSWSAPVSLNEISVKSFEWISLRSRGKKVRLAYLVEQPALLPFELV